MSLPDKCPFCDAGPGQYVNNYLCGTFMRPNVASRVHQTKVCLVSERARLAARVAELEARCKRLEELESKLEEEQEAHAWEISPAMAQAKIDELNAKVATLDAREKQAREDEAWANERTVLVEFQPVTSGWYASAPDGVVGINATAPTIHGALRSLREKMEARPAETAKPCPYCLRVECECSDFDVAPDMGDK